MCHNLYRVTGLAWFHWHMHMKSARPAVRSQNITL
jgi:hypothetical protein